MVSFPGDPGPFPAMAGSTGGGHLPNQHLPYHLGLEPQPEADALQPPHAIPKSPERGSCAFLTLATSSKMGSCFWHGPRMLMVWAQSHIFQAVVKALQITGNFISHEMKGSASARTFPAKGQQRISCQHWEGA